MEQPVPATVPVWADRLVQTEVWYNKQGVPIPLQTMDRRYRLNVLNWIWTHAERIAETVLFHYLFLPGPRDEDALDAFEREMEWLELDPIAYLAETPLVRALLGDDLARVSTGPEPVAELLPIDASDVIDYLTEILARGRHCDDPVLDACYRTLAEELRVEWPDDVEEWNRVLRRVFDVPDPRLGPEPDL